MDNSLCRTKHYWSKEKPVYGVTGSGFNFIGRCFIQPEQMDAIKPHGSRSVAAALVLLTFYWLASDFPAEREEPAGTIAGERHPFSPPNHSTHLAFLR